MTEHQVVVTFDVTATSRTAAGETVRDFLVAANATGGFRRVLAREIQGGRDAHGAIAAEQKHTWLQGYDECLRQISTVLNRLNRAGIESWWFPEADLKPVDGNDNGAFRLVPDEFVECPICQGSAEIRICANDGSHGCSHVNDREYRCGGCDATGQVRESDLEHPDWCKQCGLTGQCQDCS